MTDKYRLSNVSSCQQIQELKSPRTKPNFRVGDEVIFHCKIDNRLSGLYVISVVYRADKCDGCFTESDNKPYVGYVYALEGVDFIVAESSLTLD